MKKLVGSTFAAGLMLATGASQAADFYVSAGAADAGLGTRERPFRSLQAAINAAASGDLIRVAAGSYRENLRIERKAIVLQGGFSADWLRDLPRNTTTLVGIGGDAVLTLIESDSTVDGFRITGGTGSTEQLPYGYHGGGIYSRAGSPTIINNLIEGNDVRSGDPPYDYFFGGGVYISAAPQATLVNNVIRGNFAGRGAGVALFAQAALVQGNTIDKNVAVGDHGGGMYIGVVNATVTQNLVVGNEVGRELGYGWGGGIIVVGPGTSAVLAFNTLTENFAAGYGAAEFIDEGARAEIHHELIYANVSKDGCEAVSAISVDGGDGVGSQANISHCTIVNNICPNSVRGNGIQVEGLSSATVANCIFWNNGGDDFAVDNTSTLRVSYTCSEERIEGAGNLNADPRFVAPATNDFRLALGSPCIDAADPAAEFKNEPAPNGGRADLGRFGNTNQALEGTLPTPTPTPTPTPAPAPTPTPVPGGGGPIGGAGSGSADPGSQPGQDIPHDGENHDPLDDLIATTGMCPAGAAMLFSLSLFGAQRSYRRRTLPAAVRSQEVRR